MIHLLKNPHLAIRIHISLLFLSHHAASDAQKHVNRNRRHTMTRPLGVATELQIWNCSRLELVLFNFSAVSIPAATPSFLRTFLIINYLVLHAVPECNVLEMRTTGSSLLIFRFKEMRKL